ncbi:MAG: HAD family hydrolase [Anaerovoracaceae bacterium]|jgi:HAD superfamily hydrolase (TIGR01509 family)
MKRGAIFDMDGLLVDTEREYTKIWKEMAEKRGIQLPDDFEERTKGRGGEENYRVLESFYHEDGRKLFLEWQDQVRLRFAEAVPAKKGAAEILDFFRGQGAKIAVASSSDRDIVLDFLKKAGLAGHFDAYVCGDEVPNGKPAPDIFLRAAAELGLSPEDCYVFEDSTLGILSASSAGCVPVMVPDTLEPGPDIRKKAKVVCRDLADAMERIRRGEL